MLNSSDNPPEQLTSSQSLPQLLRNHPIALLCGFWVVVVLAGSVAIVGLLNPGPLESEASKSALDLTQLRESTTKDNAAKNEELPVSSLFGAIALGCAAGSLLVTQALRYSIQTSHSPKRLRSKRKKRQRPPQKRSRPVSEKPPIIKSPPPPRQVNSQPVTPPNPVPQVTVLSPDKNHPLDGQSEGLAEMMDWRKRNSLTSVMRNR